MTAPRVSDRPTDIVRAAARAFALAGYHRTQMVDIAAQAGVALGTLYRYATSKDELFLRALALGSDEAMVATSAIGPIGDIEHVLATYADSWFGNSDPSSQLFDGDTPVPVATGVARVYDGIAARHLAIRMLDRSAHDLPRLSAAYNTRVRGPALAVLVAYLKHLSQAERIRHVEDLTASSRFILETCAWFAMHRHFSPGGADISNDVARRTALTHITAAFHSTPHGR